MTRLGPLNKTRLLLVTGLSGAGKSTALRALEDLGYEAVDNLPLSLIQRLLITPVSAGERQERPLAIGVDSRTRAFGERSAVHDIERLRKLDHLDLQVLFFDCDDEILAQRFSQTRRRHPMAQDRRVMDGIVKERQVMAGVRDTCDTVFDTGGFTVHDLKRRMTQIFGLERETDLTLTVMSFGFTRGVPRDADLVFDLRFLRNPFFVPELRHGTGLDEGVAAYVAADPDFDSVFKRIRDLLEVTLPRYADEGKSYLTICLGCTGGRHRSVFAADFLAKTLEKDGYRVHISHRDIKRDPTG